MTLTPRVLRSMTTSDQCHSQLTPSSLMRTTTRCRKPRRAWHNWHTTTLRRMSMMTSLRSHTIPRKRTRRGTPIGARKRNDPLVGGLLGEMMGKTMASQPTETAPAEASPLSPPTLTMPIMASPAKRPQQGNRAAIDKRAPTLVTGRQRKVRSRESLSMIQHNNLHSADAAHHLTTPTRVKKRLATSQTSEIREVLRTRAMAIARVTQEKPQDSAHPSKTAKTLPTTKMTNKNK